jgi:hypothetical protein
MTETPICQGNCQGNVLRGPALDDVAPIRMALETVPLTTC